MVSAEISVRPLEGRVATNLGLAPVVRLALVGGRGRGCAYCCCCGSKAATATGTDPIGRRLVAAAGHVHDAMLSL
jgi:hypothetical protein